MKDYRSLPSDSKANVVLLRGDIISIEKENFPNAITQYNEFVNGYITNSFYNTKITIWIQDEKGDTNYITYWNIDIHPLKGQPLYIFTTLSGKILAIYNKATDEKFYLLANPLAALGLSPKTEINWKETILSWGLTFLFSFLICYFLSNAEDSILKWALGITISIRFFYWVFTSDEKDRSKAMKIFESWIDKEIATIRLWELSDNIIKNLNKKP